MHEVAEITHRPFAFARVACLGPRALRSAELRSARDGNFPGPFYRAESDELADRIEAHFAKHGFGYLAAELIESGAFIGFVGLCVPSLHSRFTPCVEIGGRLAAEYWGRGHATEGAREAMRYAFNDLSLDSLVVMTAPANLASRRVMEKLLMTHDPADDADHPVLPAGHPFRHPVLYRLRRK